jgi:predicted TPR repeat methyltransferase
MLNQPQMVAENVHFCLWVHSFSVATNWSLKGNVPDMNRAERRRQRKKAEKAAKNAKLVQSANPSPEQPALTIEHAQAIELAMQHQTAGRLPQAESIYQQILQADPNQPDALHLLGVIAHQVGKSNIAVDLITQALAINPNLAEAHNNLGNTLKDLGNLDEAEASYREALAINPNLAEAHNNLGNALKELGKLDEAVANYHKALAIKPDYAAVHNNLGNALIELGRLDEAVVSYHKFLAIKPDYAEVHNNLGNALKELERLDEAEASYREAIAINPNLAEAHNNLGNALLELERLDEAVASYQNALAIKPDYAEAHYNLGNALIELGRLDEAVASYKKAISIKPDFHTVRHILNSLLGNTTDCAPREYVERAFNPYAEKFENHLVNDLAYKMPYLLKKVLLDLGLIECKLKKVIDLGCGTGLAGVEFKDIAESLIGIDLSENMVRKAEKKNIYDELYVDDIIDRLESLETKFDLFIASDVFIYIGNLLPLFQCVKKHSKKNTLFVFSTEHTDCNDYILLNTHRFAHSKDYVLSVATESGFQLEYFTQSNLRKGRKNWIIGGIYALRSV